MARKHPGNSLTAAGQSLRVSSYEESALLQLSRQEWTNRAWGYYESVGEVRYAANFVANALSRLRLIAATTPSATSDAWEPIEVKEGAVADAVKQLTDPRGGQRGLLRSIGLNLFIPGEAFLLGQMVNGAQQWECLSSDELDVRTGYPQFFRRVMPNTTPVPIPEDALVIRVWKEHPRWTMLSDSAMRTVLDQCETLLILTRMERAAARSRFAGSGILFIPNELLPSGSRGESDTDFYSKLMESMIAPIKDESHPSSVVPILLTGPAEYGKAIQHITMDRQLDGDALVKLKEDAVKRLAAAFDLPSEVLTGNADLNHWGMAVVREETFAAHIQPFAEMVVDALTSSYLHPALKKNNVANWQDYKVWFDKSALVQKADQSDSADQAHDRLTISDTAYRHAKGFSLEDAPSDEERAKRVGVKLAQPDMALTGKPPAPPPEQPAAAPAPAGGDAGSGGSGRGRKLETVQPNKNDGPQGKLAAPPKQASERRVSSTSTAPTEKPKAVAASSGPVPFTSISEHLGRIDMNLLSQLQVLMESALKRTAEKAGAKVRSKSFNNVTVRESLSGVPNSEVIRTLGPSMVAAMGFVEADLVATSVGVMDAEITALLHDAYLSSMYALDYLGERASLEGLISTRYLFDEMMWANIEEANRVGATTLNKLASRYFFYRGDKEDDPKSKSGEASSLTVQPGDVREIMVRAGGTAPFGNSSMRGGVATGKAILEYADSLGVDVRHDEYIWLYGDTLRQRGFQGHMQLDGAIFTSIDDPVLAVWPEDQWLRVANYSPGDHLGCACIATPVIREPDGSLSYPRLA